MLFTQQYYKNQAFGGSLSLVFMPCHASLWYLLCVHRKFVIRYYSLNSALMTKGGT